MTDNYIFNKAMEEQSLNDNSQFSKINYLSINDINSGIYNNNGLTQIQYDLTSIYNSSSYTDVSQMYLTVPIVMAAAYNTSADINPIAPPAGSNALVCMKSMPFQFIH